MLVQAGIDAHIAGAHLRLGELADLLDRSRCALLEANVVHSLRQVNGALAGHHLIDGGLVALLGLGLRHFSAAVCEAVTTDMQNIRFFSNITIANAVVNTQHNRVCCMVYRTFGRPPAFL